MRLGVASKWSRCSATPTTFPPVHVTAGDLFLKELAGVSDPETKRKTTAGCSSSCDAEAKKIAARFPAQGTLYPDVIESVSFNRRARR